MARSALIDSGLGCRESRRCSRDTCPESYITKYTSIRRQNWRAWQGLRSTRTAHVAPLPRSNCLQREGCVPICVRVKPGRECARRASDLGETRRASAGPRPPTPDASVVTAHCLCGNGDRIHTVDYDPFIKSQLASRNSLPTLEKRDVQVQVPAHPRQTYSR